jgi:transcriptional regulator with XRE-family HTH domain
MLSSILLVSQRRRGSPYSANMGKTTKTPLGWGAAFRQHAKGKGLSLGQIAERMNLAESTLRSWTNGQRDINLSDYLKLCRAAGIDPAVVLFAGQVDAKFLAVGEAWAQSDETGRQLIELAADAARERANVVAGKVGKAK